MTHVGGRYHHISLPAQFRHHLAGLGNDAAKFDVLHMLWMHHLVGIFGRQAHHANPQVAQREDFVGRKHALAAFVDVG